LPSFSVVPDSKGFVNYIALFLGLIIVGILSHVLHEIYQRRNHGRIQTTPEALEMEPWDDDAADMGLWDDDDADMGLWDDDDVDMGLWGYAHKKHV
jgi:hypothetical protein